MSSRYPLPSRPPMQMISSTCTAVYAYASMTCGVSHVYREPLHAQCTYCMTRYYLAVGDRMNCSQCGAPL
jgi:hypothetical protein